MRSQINLICAAADPRVETQSPRAGGSARGSGCAGKHAT